MGHVILDEQPMTAEEVLADVETQLPVVPVVGKLARAAATDIADAVSKAGYRAQFVSKVSEVRQLVAREGQSSTCVIFDAASSVYERLINDLAAQMPRVFENTRFIALVKSPTYSAFSAGIRAGADDVVLVSDLGAITRRVAATGGPCAPRKFPSRGVAIVAHPDHALRLPVGHALKVGGYTVEFAATAEELRKACAQQVPGLVVMNPELLGPGDVSDLRQCAGSPKLPLIMLRPRRDCGQQSFAGLPYVAEVFEDRPWDHLAFQVNELVERSHKDVRTSQRILRTTLCTFREEGRLDSSYGVTYNISDQGAFVRTLDAPRKDSVVWLEFRPHEAGRAVHLRGRVMWVNSLAGGCRTLSPPGFGIKLIDELCPPDDLQRYRRVYQNLLELQRNADTLDADVGGVEGTQVRFNSVIPSMRREQLQGSQLPV